MEDGMLVPVIIASVLTLMCVYGVVTQKLIFTRHGLFWFGITVFLANMISAVQAGGTGESEIIMITTGLLYGLQAVLMYPFITHPFDNSNKAAYFAQKRIAICITSINGVIPVLYLLGFDLGIPDILPIYHGVIALLGLGMTIKFFQGSVVVK
jgi:hypothetical protein